MTTRRDALRTLAAAATALPVLHAQPVAAAPTAFSTEEFALLSRMVDDIIPRTDTPGAADAGVPLMIDEQAARNPTLAGQIRQGLAWLKNENYLHLDDAHRAEILRSVSETEATPSGLFFRRVKDMTIDAYYSTREGLVTELGYHGNTYLTSFPGCTHPEHQRD
jgi:gluconate 2-dehydrogenase gamma chain